MDDEGRVRLQLEAFGTAIKTRDVYPVPFDEVINGLAAFEGVLASLESGRWATLAAIGASK